MLPGGRDHGSPALPAIARLARPLPHLERRRPRKHHHPTAISAMPEYCTQAAGTEMPLRDGLIPVQQDRGISAKPTAYPYKRYEQLRDSARPKDSSGRHPGTSGLAVAAYHGPAKSREQVQDEIPRYVVDRCGDHAPKIPPGTFRQTRAQKRRPANAIEIIGEMNQLPRNTRG